MNKYAKLAQNTVIFAIGSFGSKILLLLLTRLYSGNINSVDTSTKSLLEQTANFIIPIVTFSIAEAVIRYGLDREYDKTEVFTSACVEDVVQRIENSPRSREKLRGISPVLAAEYYVGGMIAAAVLATGTLFLFNVIFISKLHWGVHGFMLAVFLSDFCSGVFLWVTARLWRFFDLKKLEPEVVRTMVRFSLPMIPTAVLWIITGFSDRLFVRYMDKMAISHDVGPAAAGIYEYASKVPNLISMVSTIFFQAWNMSAIKENDSKDKGVFYERIFGAYQAFMFLGAGFMIAFVRILSAILIDYSRFPEYRACYLYTPILIIAVVMMSFDQFLSSVYVATQKTSHSMWTALIAAGTNIIMNILLIYRWGVQGAVVATFLSYFACYLVRIVDTRRMIYFKVSHLRFFANLVLLFVMSGIAITRPVWEIPATAVLVGVLVLLNYPAIQMMVRILEKVLHRVTKRA